MSIRIRYLQRREAIRFVLITDWRVDLRQTHYRLVAEPQSHHLLVLAAIPGGDNVQSEWHWPINQPIIISTGQRPDGGGGGYSEGR